MNTPFGAGISSFAGDSLTINGGSLALRNSSGGSITVNSLILDGGTVVSAGNLSTTINGNISLTSDSVFRPANTGRVQTINASISGVGGISIRSDASAGGTVIYNSASNSYQGNTTVESGAILRMGVANAMPDAPTDGDLAVQSGGAFQLNGFNTTIQGLSGAGTVENGGNVDTTLTMQGSGNFTGTVQQGGGTGTLDLVKTGAGTQTFSSASISGVSQFTVQGGTLALSGATSIGGTPDFFVDSGTLDVSTLSGGLGLNSGQSIFGNGDVAGNVVANSGASIDPGIGGIGALSFANDLDLSDNTLWIELTGASSDVINVAGIFDIASATLDFDVLSALTDSVYVFATYGSLTGSAFNTVLDTPAGYSIDYNYSGNQVALVQDSGPGPGPVPSQAPLFLMAIGAFGLASRRRWVNR